MWLRPANKRESERCASSLFDGPPQAEDRIHSVSSHKNQRSLCVPAPTAGREGTWQATASASHRSSRGWFTTRRCAAGDLPRQRISQASALPDARKGRWRRPEDAESVFEMSSAEELLRVLQKRRLHVRPGASVQSVPRSYAGQSAPWRLLDACPRCGEERMTGRNELGGWCDVCGASWP